MKVFSEVSMIVLVTLMGYILMGEAFKRSDTFNKCGRELNIAVSVICHGERRSGVINENSGLNFRSRRQIADECCDNTCTVGHILDYYCENN